MCPKVLALRSSYIEIQFGKLQCNHPSRCKQFFYFMGWSQNCPFKQNDMNVHNNTLKKTGIHAHLSEFLWIAIRSLELHPCPLLMIRCEAQFDAVSVSIWMHGMNQSSLPSNVLVRPEWRIESLGVWLSKTYWYWWLQSISPYFKNTIVYSSKSKTASRHTCNSFVKSKLYSLLPRFKSSIICYILFHCSSFHIPLLR